jgi:hypothetical protein
MPDKHGIDEVKGMPKRVGKCIICGTEQEAVPGPKSKEVIARHGDGIDCPGSSLESASPVKDKVYKVNKGYKASRPRSAHV